MAINGIELKLLIDLQHTAIDGIRTAEITYSLVLIFLAESKEENEENFNILYF
jgi:hypothetical protein